MKKICLIENLSHRQKEHLEYLTKYENILDNIIDERYEVFYSDMLAGKINLNYGIVMIHESAFAIEHSRNFLRRIMKYCKSEGKKLVTFSGGAVSDIYLEELGRLELKSSTFYSNLKEFLESQNNDDDNLLILAYGKNWKENLYMDIQQKLKTFIRDNKGKLDEIFPSGLVYSFVNLKLLPPEINNISDNFKLEDLDLLNSKLIKYISEM